LQQKSASSFPLPVTQISLEGHHFFPYTSPAFPLPVTQISLEGHSISFKGHRSLVTYKGNFSYTSLDFEKIFSRLNYRILKYG
jgi:hypothetical protein